MDTQQQVQPHQGWRPRLFYGWYIVGAGMGLQLWIALAWVYGMQIFFTPIVEAFGWSRAVVSGAFSLQRLEGSIATPIEGFLVDRYGPRKLILMGAFVVGLGLISLSFLQTVWMFYASVLVVSLGSSLAMGVPRTWTVVQWFRRLRGRALGVMSSGAAASGPLVFIVVWLVETFGWRQAFMVLGLVSWVVCIPLAFVFRARPQQYGYLPDGGRLGDPSGAAAGAQPEGKGRAAGRDLTAGQALRTPAFWILVIVFAAQTLGVSGLIVHQVPYFESIGFSKAEAASVLALFTALSIFGRLGGGWAMDYVNPRLVLAGLLGFQAVAFLILANITSYWQVVPFAVLYGTSFGGMQPSRGVIISAYFGAKSFGAIQGLSQSATVLAGVVAPVLMGWIYDQTGSYVQSIYIIMAVTAAAIPLAIVARPPRRAMRRAAT